MEHEMSFDELVTQLVRVVDEANEWGQKNHWPAFSKYPQYDRIREIGEQINEVAGFDGMQEACLELQRSCKVIRGISVSAPAEYSWMGIGGWMP